MSKDEYVAARDKKKVEFEEERDLVWGGGLKQRREAQERARALEQERGRPFARCVGS